MSELEELPSWAGRSTASGQSGDKPAPAVAAAAAAAAEPAAQEPTALGQQLSQQQHQIQQQVLQPRRRPWRMVLFALLGVLALLAMGAGGYFLASSQDSTETEAAGDTTNADGGQLASQELEEEVVPEETETVAADADAEATTDADATADDDAAAGDDGDSDTVTVDVDAEDDANAEEADAETETETDTEGTTAVTEERRAIFRGGVVYLQGAVPSEEIGLAIQEKAAAVVGPDNVVNEYVIDPESVIEPGVGAPLYVEDVVLFEFNSVSVAQPFLPILDLGTLLLRQNPQATVTVVTRTDAIGSESVNLDVSTKRAQAIINYWLGKGVNPDQINADPRGEEGASENDDEQTAALNRRAEFIIAGLLD